jgi:hypothetical protein
MAENCGTGLVPSWTTISAWHFANNSSGSRCPRRQATDSDRCVVIGTRNALKMMSLLWRTRLLPRVVETS